MIKVIKENIFTDRLEPEDRVINNYTALFPPTMVTKTIITVSNKHKGV
jgi:hypothetical protein